MIQIVSIVSIGDELISGTCVNTNAAWIGFHLVTRGWRVDRHITLPDDPVPLKKGLEEVCSSSPIVIATGGLGPTGDDHTRQVSGDLFDSPMSYCAAVAMDLKNRIGTMLPSLENQATIPIKATPLFNSVGTAPGLILRDSRRLLILLPGVPQEMHPMFLQSVIPYLEQEVDVPVPLVIETLHFCLLSETLIDPLLRDWVVSHKERSYGIYPAYGSLTIVLRAPDRSHFVDLVSHLRNEYSTYFFISPSGTLAEAIHLNFLQRGKTLAIAESCTGGILAAQFTSYPGSSSYFLGSIVAYSNMWKKGILHVREDTLSLHGAVSKEVVEEMLDGVLSLTQADMALAISGIAGPTGGSLEKPVGTVWMGFKEEKKNSEIVLQTLKGDRAAIIYSGVQKLLGALWRKIQFDVSFSSSLNGAHHLDNGKCQDLGEI